MNGKKGSQIKQKSYTKAPCAHIYDTPAQQHGNHGLIGHLIKNLGNSSPENLHI